MSTLFSYYAYAGPTPPDAPAIMARVEAGMRAQGLIEGENDPSTIVEKHKGPVFRPGPGLDAYYPEGRSHRKSLENGMAFYVRPILSLGQLVSPESWRCPYCRWRPCDDVAKKKDRELRERMYVMIGNAAYEANFAPDATVCLNCDRPVPVNDWCEPFGPSDEYGFLVAGCGVEAEHWTRSPQMIAAITGILKDAAPGRRIVIDAFRL